MHAADGLHKCRDRSKHGDRSRLSLHSALKDSSVATTMLQLLAQTSRNTAVMSILRTLEIIV